MTTCYTALIRCDASPAIGYGHLMRCLALGEQMQSSERWKVIFAMAEDASSIARARSKDFEVEQLDNRAQDHAEIDWLMLLVDRHQANVMVVDVRNDLGHREMNRLRKSGVIVICIDDISERRLAADLAFYPPVPQVRQLDWTNFDGRWHAGWEWIMMPAQFAAVNAMHPSPVNDRLKLLVTMGGSDPAGMTLKAVDALDTMDDEFDTVIVIGSEFVHSTALNHKLNHTTRNYRLLINPPSMASVMADMDLALASFGATAYELACVGIPAVHLCLTADHTQSASALDDAGVAINLGLFNEATPTAIRGAVKQLLDNAPRRREMREIAHGLIDGRGTERIITELNELVEAKHETCN